MKKIGVLRGMENTFPEALISSINKTYGNQEIRAEFVSLDSVSLTGETVYDVILDRISHEIPFFRSYLKWAALKGTYVVNNPFWWSADDKFIDNVIAAKLGVAVPRTVILPHKQHPPNTQATSFRNLRFPIDWPATFAHVGFPAFLKPHDGGGWRGVTKVRNPQEFFAAYDASGTSCMMLQESVEFEDYFRCYCIGRTEVHVMRYNPNAPHDQRYSAVARGPIPAAMRHRLERDVRALCSALGYDINTVEFAVRGGVPYAIDFMNPAPDADRHSVGEANFDWVIKTTGAFLVAKAREDRRPPQFDSHRLLFDEMPPFVFPPLPEPKKGEPAKIERPKAEHAKPEPARAEPPKAVHPKAEHPKAEPIKPPHRAAVPPSAHKPEPPAAAKLAAKPAKPTTAPKTPVKVVPKAIPGRIKPAKVTAKPAKAAPKPTKAAPRPAKGPSKPAKAVAKPTPSRIKPAKAVAKPTPSRIKPAKAAAGRVKPPAKKPAIGAKRPAKPAAPARPKPTPRRPAAAKPSPPRTKPASKRGKR